jgi:hypothetical protein
MDFTTFKVAIAKQFERMAKHHLFRTGVEKDAMWLAYLAVFPDGTNPIYRERTEHDCNCCKGFIRAVGNVVAIIDGQIVSVWDASIGDPAYQAVADAMARLVKSQPVANTFLHFEDTAGTDRTLADRLGGVASWTHFFVNLPRRYVMKGSEIGAALGTSRAHHDVLARSLTTITDEAIDTVLDLIAQNALYRGAENKATVVSFKALKDAYAKLREADRDNFVWAQLATVPGAVSKLRNTSIGTLLVDLSEGKDLEAAVRAFEVMVAPTNYKRPTALVTKAMIENARLAITEMGLSSALERRYAVIEDITVNNVLFANRNARRAMAADVFGELSSKVSATPKSFDKADDVPIDKFIADILPRAESLELMVENRHVGNLVSLVAPADPTAKNLFKWGNPFSWSYNGDFADSIKERVKKAGGSVEGDLCCRLAWEYSDDLDFHMKEPGGFEINFRNRGRTSPAGGVLDVDANGIDGIRNDPAENIVYADRRRMAEGIYRLYVVNYSRRSPGVGFEVEIEFDGQCHRMAFEKPLRTDENVTVARIQYSHADGFKILESLPSSQTTREVWGIATQTFRPVNVLMLSPNYWDERAVGNKHWFFMLDGCRNDGQARGFFNEFLTEDLTVHRRVIEMVGSRMKTDASERQLSGLGFSSTQRNSVLCRVTGNFSRVINLVF